MTTTSIQNSFNSGEISPNIWGRTDIAKLRNGASTMRNFYVDYRGGAVSRAGLAYVGMCKQGAPNVGGTVSGQPPRDIPFQFNIYQGFVLEFGEAYMRVKSQGAYVTEAAKAITGITRANPAVFSVAAHGYSVGDWLYISGATGMTNFNGLTWVVNSVIDVNHFTVTSLFADAINSTSYNAYVSGGTTARIYTVVSPYGASDLPYLKYTQSKDVISLCCVNQQTGTEYRTYNLQRFGATNWQFGPVTFTAAIGPPSGVMVTAQSSTTVNTFYSYAVTAVSTSGKEESVASVAVACENNNISIFAGSNTVSWNAVPDAASYNVYRATPSYNIAVPVGVPYGFIGVATGTNFTDSNITADFNKTPPLHDDPFSALGIDGVIVTNPGNGAYTEDNIGYFVNTATGIGFSGTPTVTDGFFSGFDIRNSGVGYLPTDTITITSGGSGPPTSAVGTYTFIANPTNGKTIVLNGVSWAFVDNVISANQTQIAGSLTSTIARLVVNLNASTNPAINVAAYSFSGFVLTITYKTTGTAGNAYTLAAGTYGGVVSGTTLTGGNGAGGGGGSGATGVIVIGPATGVNPGVVAYYQQRRGYANTLNEPDTYFFSRPGAFENMDSSNPVQDDDAIIGAPWAQQINGIQFMVPMQVGLIILTGNSIWLLNGGTNAALTPADQTAVTQVYNGCSPTVPPLVVDNSILYVQSKGSIVRDLSYNFIQGNYSGTDRTVLSSHLFDNHSVEQWAYAQEPNKINWTVRDDGIVLSFTILKEQDVYGWARHDTDGFFKGVCSITERRMVGGQEQPTGPLTDSVYFIVQRFLRGTTAYYSERMDDRAWSSPEDCWCVDAGLAYPRSYPNTQLQPLAATGNGVTFVASASVFTPASVGSVIRAGGGIATVISQTGTQAVVNITQDITDIIPNNPGLTPAPQASGEWSIGTPVVTINGLNHLEGLTVTGLADGSVISPQVVTNGAITLAQPATAIVVGLPYLPQLQTIYLDPPNQTGTTQTRRKTVNSVGVRMTMTRGISVATNQPDASTQPDNATVPWTALTQVKQAAPPSAPGNAIPLFTGDYFMNVGSAWDSHAQVAIQQEFPLPANISAIITYYNLGDT